MGNEKEEKTREYKENTREKRQQFGKRRAEERFVLWEMKKEKTRREISIGNREIRK